MELGLLLIPILILVSGVVAYIGNLVGRATGRRRLSAFGLRPRHTAHIISVVTGMLITIISLATVLLFSQDARVGLFRLDDLRAQIDDAEARLREVAGGDIAYLRNQEVLRDLIDGRRPQPEVMERLDALRLRAVDVAVSNGIAPDLVTGGVLSLYPPNLTWESIARLIALRRTETVVRIVAQENTLAGEPLRVSVLIVDRTVIYRRGTVVLTGTVDPKAGREEVGRELLRIVDAAAERTLGRLLSPPLARITETPRAQLDVDHHRAVIAEILARGREVRVDVTAQRDLTVEMPLVARFVVHP